MDSQPPDQTGTSVLLIGGTGYVGDAMRQRLREAGHQVTLLVRPSSSAERYEQEGFATAQGDVTDPNSLVRALDRVRPDAVINLVAIIKEKGKATFEQMNYRGTVNVVDAMRQTGINRILQMSALGAGNVPGFPYHYTKWKAENYVKDSGMDWTIFRPSIVFGPGQHEQFVEQLADVVRMKIAPVLPVVGDGMSRFQPVHLDDVAASYERALRDPATTARQIYELAGPEVLTYEEILDECARVLGTQKRKLHVPVALMTPAAALMGAVPFFEAPVTTEQLKMLKLDNTTLQNAVPTLTGRPAIPFRGNIDYIAG
ncbi:MAG TPA: complex I NDUFA9 subunit family protein [Thermomicrobiales bacterium]|nr:complex I NDUFA9 subunit family protein [Thermomicrobiales bacterium]